MSSDVVSWTYELATEEDTSRFGAALGAVLGAGDLVLLDGPLGAGKTALTRGIARGMGVSGRVTSPTFVLAREHYSSDWRRPALVHVDAYRLTSLAELDDLDLDTELTEAAVVVEWGGGFAERLAEDHLLVRIERREDETRAITLYPQGRRWQDRLPPAFE
ncbi:tRNA (adenosine(37)-N6)-threonylcarbamoyltransferase complex ATPase subunit type 1 TsaE [Actinopolyspora erythraea]|uniref:tRNA threonylcarbamoyladenosine biosynthesis protein TsaE n=2 Tax=Actinopolyspora TaxID=1849 RepID=A0A099D8U0_9ACTN|nr:MULTISPECIES: tRNA (adenosine(37)-N6)-threonylcarbamoyltransferase complex ATPase subunit type 1 TsaE [Actinopolyspora]ASU80118.1 tRNA (adenosine(37)-N6)-threonylcarbamoyltransferase complex ATPase subunit type 1 TsaE [Actinopolyspora erythraea]KGI82513.1 ATP-binding protein [Actinopolyspora erythraea]SDP12428.1 tRNA threonylcarbamoyladenosine biosynthesis protein TsaE [Actinopolyspora xinjiangensis]